jgi:phosphatidylglycerophosphate synthase
VIKIAYLVGAESPATTIAGLPVLLRQALSLQEAGIDALALVGVRDRSVLRDPRLRIPVRDASIADVGANGPALVAAVGCVWPQALVRWLVDVDVDEGDVATRGEGGTAILACGAGRVREIVERVGRGEFGKPPQSPREIDASVAMLLQSLYKPTDGLIARSIDRRVSLAITRRLLTTGITPNQMTLLATLVGALGVMIVARGGYWNVLAGTALFEAQGILDGCDGEIARIKHLHSRAGEWLDQVADDVLNIALLVSVGSVLAADGYRYAMPLTRFAAAAQLVFAVALYAGLITTGGGGSVARLRWWVDGPRAPAASGAESSSDRFWRFIVHTFGDLTRRDFISFFYLASAVAGWMHAAFVWQALVTIGSAVATSVQWIVWGGPELQSPKR